MSKGILLLADNKLDFLNAMKEFFENSGYQVLAATNPLEAQRLLENQHIDLCILDVRLVDDNDSKDFSGIKIAREYAFSVPKIMLTGFPTVEAQRKSFNLIFEGIKAVDFVAKEEGAETLLEAVKKALSRNVFIVHGHDEAILQTIARFLEQLGLFPIIAREQLKSGRTSIEVFEDYSNVSFAVVLLTPDDEGRSRQKSEKARLRARQNVIFEWGYFVGKLGRQKVGTLWTGQIELPSDNDGVLRISLDTNDWKLALAREMKNAGVPIDLKRVG